MATIAESAIVTDTTAWAEANTLRRERKRLEKQRNRQRRAEEAQRKAADEAERQEREDAARERRDEILAPAIARQALTDRAGRMIRGPLVEVIEANGRPRALLAGAAIPHFSDRQSRAARKLQLDHRDVGSGCNAPAVDYDRCGGSGDGLGGHDAMVTQLETQDRLRAALAALGAFRAGVVRVVLDQVPIGIWSREIAEPPPDPTAWIRAGLDRLARHYWPPREAQSERTFVFGPARGSYVTELTEG